MSWIDEITNAAVILSSSGILHKRIKNQNKKALKQMQTALWNDRQLRQGRTPGEVRKVV